MGSEAGGHSKQTSSIAIDDSTEPKEFSFYTKFRGNTIPTFIYTWGSSSAPSQTLWPSGESTGLGSKQGSIASTTGKPPFPISTAVPTPWLVPPTYNESSLILPVGEWVGGWP